MSEWKDVRRANPAQARNSGPTQRAPPWTLDQYGLTARECKVRKVPAGTNTKWYDGAHAYTKQKAQEHGIPALVQ